MFFFMTINKKRQGHPLCFFSFRPMKNRVTPHVSFDKNDSATPYVLFDIDRQCYPLRLFLDGR